MRDADGFALALGADDAPERSPGFPHFGFAVDGSDEVRRLRDRLIAEGVDLPEQEETEAYVGFKCRDPDGHLIEVAWEPVIP